MSVAQGFAVKGPRLERVVVAGGQQALRGGVPVQVADAFVEHGEHPLGAVAAAQIAVAALRADDVVAIGQEGDAAKGLFALAVDLAHRDGGLLHAKVLGDDDAPKSFLSKHDQFMDKVVIRRRVVDFEAEDCSARRVVDFERVVVVVAEHLEVAARRSTAPFRSCPSTRRR